LDYARKRYLLEQQPVVEETPVTPPIPPIFPSEEETSFTVNPGPFYGPTPPEDPLYGWSWVNPANNGLYVYTDPGVWTQIGTNW
jgi:hypothetical protein